jgi:hypothetical protein
MQIRSIVRRGAAVLLLASLASATTYTVDPNGTGNFTDIQTAILAAQPGDVLLVHAGTYAPFALDRGLTIIGYGLCSATGPITIAGIPVGFTGVVVGVESATLDIQGCAGHVIVQDMQQPTLISVQNSPDVRFARVSMPAHSSATPTSGLTLSASRFELVSSTIRGSNGAECAASNLQGGVGLTSLLSRVHVAHSGLHGGNGSHCDQANYYCGGGEEALILDNSSQGIFCGASSDQVEGGYGPLNLYYLDCAHDGWASCAVRIDHQSALRRSGVTVIGYPWAWGWQCQPVNACQVGITSGTDVQPPLPDPSLTVSGNPAPGSPVQFTLDGPPGATAVLSFGRNPVVQSDPNTVIEVLVPPLRNVNLGTIPASGSVSFTWPIASVLQPGSRLLAQGRVALSGGEVRRTNSVPVILR